MSAKTGLAMEQMKSIYLTSQPARTLRKELSGQKMKLVRRFDSFFAFTNILPKKIAAKFWDAHFLKQRFKEEDPEALSLNQRLIIRCESLFK